MPRRCVPLRDRNFAGFNCFHPRQLSSGYPPILIAISRRDDRVHPRGQRDRSIMMGSQSPAARRISQAKRFCDQRIDATARTGPPSLCAVTETAPLAVKFERGTVQLTVD